MRGQTVIAVSAMLLTLSHPAAQQTAPARDRAASSDGVIRGRVAAASGQPLARTHLTLTSDQNRVFIATTNPDGDYEFTGLTAGIYRLRADRTGYIPGWYGVAAGAHADSPATRLVLERQQIVEPVNLTLTFGAILEGRVLDEAGQPVSARVEALPAGTDRTEQFWAAAGAAPTNEGGRYRITGLPAGTYVIRASLVTNSPNMAPEDSSRAYAPTYFPGALDAAGATTVIVAASARLEGVDIPIATVPRISAGMEAGRTPPRTDSAEAAMTVSGTAMTPDGSPVRRATITFVSVPPGSPPNAAVTVTNEFGEFRLDHVQAGRYRVTIVGSSAYVPTFVGKRRPDDPGDGSLLEVTEGGNFRNVRFIVAAASTLAGRVVDALGQPVPDVKVIALEERYVEGQTVRLPGISRTGNATTDALGEFRISGLLAGRYYLRATSRELWPGRLTGQTLAFAETFYPGVDYASAPPIDAAGGQTEEGLNITMLAGPAVRVTGRLASRSGEGIAGTAVGLQYGFRGSPGVAGGLDGNGRTGDDGQFEIRDVPPGDYLLTAGGTASRFITVPPVGLDGVSLVERESGGIFRGTIVTDDGTPPPFLPGGISMTAPETLDDQAPSTRLTVIVRPDWSFSMVDVRKPRLLRLSGLPDGYALSAVMHDGENITDRAIEAMDDAPPLEGIRLIVTNKTGAVSGRVMRSPNTIAPDAMVIVFADDQTKWSVGTRHVRTAYTNDRGGFEVRGLLPGAYRVAAPQKTLPGQWLNPDYLGSLLRAATRVVVSAGAAVGDLRIMVTP